jgi:hypothetical protein
LDSPKPVTKHQTKTDTSIDETTDVTKPIQPTLTLDLSVNWTIAEKPQLEIIIEQSKTEAKKGYTKLEDRATYRYLSSLNALEAANEVLEIVSKRYFLLCRTLSDDNKLNLNKIFVEPEPIFPHPNHKKELSTKLKSILSKEKVAAFRHIKNTLLVIGSSLGYREGLARNIGVQMLCVSISELYSGDQRFFKEEIKTRSQVAKEGGIARQDRHSKVKRKACELLNTLTPQDGWTSDLDAFKAILPGVQNYMKENNTRDPAQHNINITLRRWIKKDPLVSAAVRIAQPTAYKEPG